MLTESQHKTYDFIKRFIDEHEYAPTIAEIAQGLGVSSRSYIHRNVHAISKEKLIYLVPNKQRNIRLSDDKDQNHLPLVGRIAAGQPIEAIEEQNNISFSELFIGHNRYILEVTGDSMIGDNICDGDLVVCEQADTARNGQIVVALVDNQEATLKRLYRDTDKNTIRLQPSNPKFSEMVYEPERVSVQGIYLGLVRLAR
jgi:repressor LexA